VHGIVGMSSEETMKIAEELYNKGHISYPRTETEVFKEGTDLMELIKKQVHSQEWGGFAHGLAEGRFVWPRKGKHDDNAHPPIHPTALVTDLEGKPKKLYEYIVRYFLACCAPDAIGAETSVTADIAGEVFTCKGTMVKQKNWLEVFKYETWSNSTIPVFVQGQGFVPSEIRMTSGSTTAPRPLKEHDLIQLMDRHGVGTDATIAQHITTVQDRNYAVKNPASHDFTPTILGKALVTGCDALHLAPSRLFLIPNLE
jgi:DNA topoisomerase-3